MRYLIGLDIDGTLITDDHVITDDTKAYIQKLMRDGHIICLLTGRPYRTAKPVYDELGLNTPIANYSGSALHNPKDSTFPSYSFKMDYHNVTDTFTKFKDDIVNAFCEIEDKVFLFRKDEKLEKWLNQDVETFQIGDFETNVNEPLNGAVFFIRNHIVDRFEKYVQDKYRGKLGFRIWYSRHDRDYTVVELFTPYANKATALEVIREYYNIDKRNTITIGDGTNDFELLEYGYYSAAMENARDTVKKSAKDVTSSNNDEGVLKYLKKVIEKKNSI